MKQKLEQTVDSKRVQFVPYDSQQAVEYLGKSYLTGYPPAMAYWVDEKGTVIGGLEAFFPFLSRHAIGKIFMFFWTFRAWRRMTTALYGLVAKHRYRWFGAQGKL